MQRFLSAVVDGWRAFRRGLAGEVTAPSVPSSQAAVEMLRNTPWFTSMASGLSDVMPDVMGNLDHLVKLAQTPDGSVRVCDYFDGNVALWVRAVPDCHLVALHHMTYSGLLFGLVLAQGAKEMREHIVRDRARADQSHGSGSMTRH